MLLLPCSLSSSLMPSPQVSIVQLKKSGLVIKSHAWDRNLGGRDVDELLCDHFAAEFKEKFKIDIMSNKKASFKLRVAVEKVSWEAATWAGWDVWGNVWGERKVGGRCGTSRARQIIHMLQLLQ